MIQFEFNPIVPTLNGVIIAALLVLLLVQGWFLARNKVISGRRRVIRAVLNGLFWLALLAFVLRPVWQTTTQTRHALLIGTDVPAAIARQVGDSLGLNQRFRTATFQNTFDSVTVLGQDFSSLTLSQLAGSWLRSIRYDAPDELQTIRWKAVLRQGEIQRVTGSLNSSQKQYLKLIFGGQPLDSVLLHKGQNQFALAFPAFSVGRTEAGLLLNGKPLALVHFFTRPLPARLYQFLLDAPDFESKTLANWLGQQGQTVQLTALLSTGIGSSLRINQSKKGPVTSPDIIITDPANAGNTTVRKAVATGKSVLFIGLTKPEPELSAINRAMGTRFGVQRISTAESVSVGVGSGQTALPYRLLPDATQMLVQGYPVAVQRTAGRAGPRSAGSSRIGVSLLTETFPLKLSGDSLTYSQLWNALLAPLQPPPPNNLVTEAPIITGFSTTIRASNTRQRPDKLMVNTDTLALSPDLFNATSAMGTFRFGRVGWQSLTDSVEVFVEDSTAFASVAARQRISALFRAQGESIAGHSPARQNQPARLQKRYLPDWAWGLVLLVCLTALWIEPKLG